MPLSRVARLVLLAVALAAPARAGVVGPAPVYAPAGGAWAGPLGVAFADPSLSALLPPSLTTLSLSPTLMPRETAPLVTQLSHALSLTPKQFAQLPVLQKKAALELAVDEVKDDLRARIYLLADRARALSAPGKSLDREGRAELYGVVANLMEIRDHYRDWLATPGAGEEPAELAALDESFKLASTAAWKTRAALIGEAGAPLGEAAAAPAPVSGYKLVPGQAAKAIREQMQASKSGWGQDDFDTLYTGYGFELRQGGKHRFYSHPAFPQLHETVSRQNDLPPGYAQSALKLIAELERLSAPKTQAAGKSDGPPATLNLADLSVLLSPPSEKPVAVKKKTQPATVRTPDVIPAKKSPEPVAVEAKTAPVLMPATEREAPPKKETPAPEKASPEKAKGLVDRARAAWARLKGKAD